MIRFNLYEIGGRASRMPRWASWLAMAGSVVVGITLFLLAASLALILVPVVLIAGSIAAWRLRSKLKAAGFTPGEPFGREPAGTGRIEVIDAECVACNLCVDVCPVEGCIAMVPLEPGEVDARTGRVVSGEHADWTSHPNNPMARAAE